MVEYAADPHYPTPDFGALGEAIGNAPVRFQQAQGNALALEEARRQLEAQKAIQAAAQSGQLGDPSQPSFYQQLQLAGLKAGGAYDPRLTQGQFEAETYAPSPPNPFFGRGGGGAEPTPVSPGAPMNIQPGAQGTDVDRLVSGIENVETGYMRRHGEDPYKAIGPKTRKGDHAYGIGQVMGANIGPWTEEVLGRRMTKEEFLNDPDAQDKVVRAKLGGYLSQYGNPQDAASMWFTGKPYEQGKGRRDVNMSGAEYVARATGGIGGGAASSREQPRAPTVSAAMGGTSAGGPDTGGRTQVASLGTSDAGPTTFGSSLGNLRQAAGPTVASLIKDPAIAARAAAALKVDPNAPLSPEQMQKLKGFRGGTLVQQPTEAPAVAPGAAPMDMRPGAQGGVAGAPSGPAAQAAPDSVSLRGYEPPLIPGYNSHEQIIDAETQWLANQPVTRNVNQQEQIRRIEADRAERIKFLTPQKFGRDIVGSHGEVLFHEPPASPAAAQWEVFAKDIQKKTGQDPTLQDVQKFNLMSKPARSGVGLYMQTYLTENPNATATDAKRAAQDYVTETASLRAFDIGLEGRTVRSYNALVPHLDTLRGITAELKNKNSPAWNAVTQEWARQTGNPAPTSFDAVRNVVKDELTKAILGSAGALGDRQEMEKSLEKVSSEKVLNDVVNHYTELASAQLRALEQQYKSSTGRDDFEFKQKLLPRTIEVFRSKSDRASPEYAERRGWPKVGTIKNGKMFTGESGPWEPGAWQDMTPGEASSLQPQAPQPQTSGIE